MSSAHTKTGAVGILGLQAGEDVKNDTGARRALAAGRVLHLVMPTGYREPELVPTEGDCDE